MARSKFSNMGVYSFSAVFIVKLLVFLPFNFVLNFELRALIFGKLQLNVELEVESSLIF